MVVSNKHYNFYNNIMWKISIQYPVLGFNPQPLEHQSPPLTTRPELPPKSCLHQHFAIACLGCGGFNWEQNIATSLDSITQLRYRVSKLFQHFLMTRQLNGEYNLSTHWSTLKLIVIRLPLVLKSFKVYMGDVLMVQQLCAWGVALNLKLQQGVS